MKKFTLLALLCMTMVSFSSFAQGMGGGMGGGMSGGMGGSRGGGMGGSSMGGGQSQGAAPQQRSININFIGSVGYFDIDSDEVLEKLKIKKNPEKEQAVVDLIARYTTAREDLVDVNRKELDVLEFAKENIEMAGGEMTAMRELVKTVGESGRIVRPKMIAIHKVLTDEMEQLLNDKELARWAKYYKKQCNANSFAPDMEDRGQRPPRGEGEEDGEPPLDSSGRPAI